MARTSPIQRNHALRICVVLAACVLVDSGAALLSAPAVVPSASTQFRDLAHSAEIERRAAAVLREGGWGEKGVLAPMTPDGPPSDPFSDDPAEAGALGIPENVLGAYQRAEIAMGTEAPDCGVTWWMVAAIGKMESDHADGGLVDEAGVTLTPILGVWLDGTNGTAAIAAPGPATSPPVWERAVGPMQFLPATWAIYGNGGDPNNINDAALAAARYLCSGDEDLADLNSLAAAVYRYNHSTAYVAAVLAWADVYALGPVLPLPSSSAGTPLPAPGTSSAATRSAAAAAVAFAADQLGLPYVWGGNGPANGDLGFDCSGLTHAAYIAAGIPTPRTAQTQYNAGPRLLPGRPLEIGDLVFYGTPDKVHHVGLYVGGGQMINAPTFGKPVKLAPYRWAGDDYVGASRPAARPGSLPFAPRQGRAMPWKAESATIQRRADVPPPQIMAAPGPVLAASTVPLADSVVAMIAPAEASVEGITLSVPSPVGTVALPGTPLPTGGLVPATPLVPGVSVPGVMVPGVSVPGVSVPGVSVPGVSVPGVMVPGVGVSGPGVSVPGVSVPGTTVPGTTVPGVPVPATTVPGTTVPGTTVPGTTVPGTTVPGTPTVTAPAAPVPTAAVVPPPTTPVVPVPTVAPVQTTTPAAAPTTAVPAPAAPVPAPAEPPPAVVPVLTRVRALELLMAGTDLTLTFRDALTGLTVVLTRPPIGG